MSTQLSWDRAGSGAPLLLVHGIGTTRQDFLTQMGKAVNARACPTKAGGTPYRGTAEFIKLADGQLRVTGQNVENLTPPQIHF